MKKNMTQKKKHPTCLAALDFEILCRTQGKEFAIKVMRLAAALGQERLDQNNLAPPTMPEPPI